MKNHSKVTQRLSVVEGEQAKQRTMLLDCMNNINQLGDAVNMLLSIFEKAMAQKQEADNQRIILPDQLNMLDEEGR